VVPNLAFLPMSDKIKSAEIGFDLSKQFLSIAFAGVAFAVGISTADGKASSSWLFWAAIIVFGLSAILGFLFLMRGVADYSTNGQCDIYNTGLRFLSLFQILFVSSGVIFLLFLHLKTKKPPEDSKAGVRIEFGGKVISSAKDSVLDVKISPDGSVEVKHGAPTALPSAK
jgi:hypothetical protein